jgi:WD40 repeat protein/tetratricopeptide (TPR) repeat protein
MPTPYHVRLALSQYGDHFRAELFTEDLGDTEGDLVRADWSILEQHWSDFLMGGGDLSSDNARTVGKEMFSKLLGGTENAAKWQQILARAGREGRPVRLLVDSTADVVRSLPFGLLCDSLDNHYVFRPTKDGPPVRFARIIRRCTPRPIQLSIRPLRMLLAVAEPTGLGFDAAALTAHFARNLPEAFEVWVCGADGQVRISEALPGSRDRWQPAYFEPFVKTTRRALCSALEQNEFEVLHLIAHGRGGDKILLCKTDASPDDVTADELGEWCQRGMQLAFLQACKASYPGEQGGYGGVAQQLLNPKSGNLAAVVAATYPIRAATATAAALDFYQGLAQEKDIDEAINRSGPLTNDAIGGSQQLDFIWAFLELWVRPRALGQTGTRGAFQFVSPYRGLSKFEERDADIFFGREPDIAELIKLIRDEPIVAIIGDSGSGKSSLLRAGLAARVRKEALRDSNWQIVSVTPGQHPVESLLAALGENSEATVSTSSVFTAIDRSCSREKPLLLLVDQAEEVLTLCQDVRERETLAIALGQAAEAFVERFRLVLAMRSDYAGRVAALPGIGHSLSRPWLLRLPTEEQFRRIVEQPALFHQYRFEGPLTDGKSVHAQPLLTRLLLDPLLERGEGAASDQSAAPLPLIEFALERLWIQAVARGSDVFTHDDYDRLGGASGAVALHAEEIYQELAARIDLGDAPQAMMERILTGLVSARQTSRPRRRSDLETESGSAQHAQRIIDHLVGERLLTLRASRLDRDEPEIELAHEVLITRWDRFLKWLEQDAETRAFIEEFQQDAERWNVGVASLPKPRQPENLPGIERAKRYLDGLERLQSPLTAAQQAFARELAELRARDTEEKDRLRAAVEQASSRAIQICVRNGTEAVKDRYLLGAWVWFAEALRLETLRGGSETSHRVRLANVQNQLPKLRHIWFHDTPADYVTFSSCGTRTLTYHPDWTKQSTIRLWDAHCRDLVTEICIDDLQGDKLAFSPDGSRVMAMIGENPRRDDDGTVGSHFRTWSSQTGKSDVIWMPDDGEEVVTFDPTGEWLLTCDAGAQFRVWEISGRKLICGPWQAEARPSVGGHNVALDVGRHRLIQTSSQTAWVWDLGNAVSTRKRDFEKSIRQTKYLYSSGRLVVATYDEVVVLDADQAALPSVKLNVEGPLEGLDGSPDGKSVLTTVKLKNDNLQSQIWSSETGRQQGAPILHEEPVEKWEFMPAIDRVGGGSGGGAVAAMGARRVSLFARAAAFAPDGRSVATVSERKKAVRVWDLKSREPLTPPLSHLNKTIGVFAFGSDGCQLATAAGDGTTRVWEIAALESDLLPIYHPNYISAVAFARDRNLLAIGSSGRSSRLFDLAGGRNRFSLGIEFENAIAFSSDGRLLAAGCSDRRAQIWDMATGIPIAPVLQHGSTVQQLAFSSDGRLLLSVGGKYNEDGEVTIWDVSSPTTLADPLRFPSTNVKSAELSRDARTVLVLTGTRREERDHVTHYVESGEVVLFDIATGRRLLESLRHSDTVRHAQFSPDGREIWTYSSTECKRWDIATGTAETISVKSYLSALKTCSPNGSRLVMQSDDCRQLQIVDATSGEPCTPQMDHPEYVNLALFSPDGRRLATGCKNEVFLWDATTGELLGPSLRCQTYVNQIAWADDGTRLAVAATASGFPQYASDTNTIFVYELQEESAAVNALILYGQAASQHRVDQAGGYVALANAQHSEVFTELYRNFGESLNANPRDILWHERQILDKGNYGERFHLDCLVRKRPKDPRHRARRAVYLRQNELLAESLADYDQAIQLGADQPELHRERAMVLLELGEWRKAVDDLAKAGASSGPPSTRQDALGEVAGWLRDRGHYADALEYYSEATALGPARRAVWGRGLTYRKMGDWRRAIVDLAEGLDQKNPRDGYVAAIVACQANDGFRYQRVCQQLLDALGNFPGDENTIERWNNTFHVAWSCVLGNRATENWSVLIQVLGAYADENSNASIRKNARLLLGAVQGRSGDYANAIARLEQTEIHPYDWLFLTIAHCKLGAGAEARRFFDLAHDLLNETLRAQNKERPSYEDRVERIICELLLAEARQLLEAPDTL